MTAQEDVDRRKIMDWIRPDIGDHGCVLAMLSTTFELDPTFFDSDYLPTFLGLGAWDDASWSNRVALQHALGRTDATVIMADARRFRARPRSLHIEVMPGRGQGGAKLHAKILLVVQERAVRLLVGSANLTESGYRFNREVALPIVATAKTPELTALVIEAIGSMRGPLKPWWTPSAEQVCMLASQTMASWTSMKGSNEFVWSSGSHPLYERFAAHWPDEMIERITIVSPFWSDEGQGGPADRLLKRLKPSLSKGSKLRLLTEAASVTQTTYRPKVPPMLAAWDVRGLGIDGEIQAVDPTVLPIEVGGRTDYQPTRPLHAKIVVIEGPATTLAYIGSANFTANGWGFSGRGANIEAGVIMWRTGKQRGLFSNIFPKVTGDRVLLDGKGAASVTPLRYENDGQVWPYFIREIRLAMSGQNNEGLELVIRFNNDEPRTPSFVVTLSTDTREVLLTSRRLATGVLEPRVLEQLLRDQCVMVRWAENCVDFPINVDLEARVALPVIPGVVPDETVLLAYYQGKIRAEDIYPPPPGEPNNSDPLDRDDSPGVETSHIQSYQIREFVEALRGISDDLHAAAKGTEMAMKHALLGEISPVALARRVNQAVVDHRRSKIAAGFQLVELLACLAKAETFKVDSERQSTWTTCIQSAREEILTLLAGLDELNDGELKNQVAFQRYRKAVIERAL